MSETIDHSAYLPHTTVAETRSIEGKVMILQEDAGDYFLYVDGEMLMGGRSHESEDALGLLGCAPLAGTSGVQVLMGGLGMGFSLRAALDVLPDDAVITVAELCDDLIEWNQPGGLLADLAGAPIEDPRTRIASGDVGQMIRDAEPASYDAILIDTDNEPRALSFSGNDSLYDESGLQAAYRALRPGGVLAFWFLEADESFDRQVGQAGFDVTRHLPPSGEVGNHLVLVALRQAENSGQTLISSEQLSPPVPA